MVYDTVLIVERNDLQGPIDTGLLSLYPHVEYPKQTWFLVEYELCSTVHHYRVPTASSKSI